MLIQAQAQAQKCLYIFTYNKFKFNFNILIEKFITFDSLIILRVICYIRFKCYNKLL
ncbi:hypothetical protein ACJX0J_039275, partial [Zea mays]